MQVYSVNVLKKFGYDATTIADLKLTDQERQRRILLPIDEPPMEYSVFAKLQTGTYAADHCT